MLLYRPLPAASQRQHGQVHRLAERPYVPVAQAVLDQEHDAIVRNRAAAVEEDVPRALVVPIVNDVFHQQGAASRGNGLEEIARLDP